MLNMDIVRSEMCAAAPLYRKFSPGPASALKGNLPSVYRSVRAVITAANSYRKGADPAVIVGEAVGTHLVRKIARPVKTRVTSAHKHMGQVRHDPFRKNGMGGRTWLLSPGRQKMVIVFHDANRAGPHIDVHIGRLSLVYRVKDELYQQLRYNRDGMLTESSRKAILDHVRSEVAQGARVPQNLDHSLTNARASWTGGDPDSKQYGSGRTRQVVVETDVDIYKSHADGPIEFYAPLLNPHRGLYLYRLYAGDSKRAPICIFGARKNQPPKLDDKLHLKMLDPKNMEAVAQKANMETSTAKYDGASGYVVISPKGTTVWSPRLSVKTGEQIEYTHKLDGIARITSAETVVAMGEILFRQRERLPWKQGRYLTAAETGGILNSNCVLPTNLKPEIRLYRVDRVGRESVLDLSFWENRALQETVAALDPKRLKVVEKMTAADAKLAGFEGVVAVPGEAPVTQGFKVKWWQDPHDWRIDQVDLKPGEKGGVAGVLHFTSLESGKKFKLGPSSIGGHELTRSIMAEPDKWVGSVLKVESRHGHEGRAAKAVGVHTDKGLAPF